MKQQEYTKKLMQLISENPELPVVPFVDNDLFCDDYGYMMGRWGNSEVDEYWVDDERVWLKEHEHEVLIEKTIDNNIDKNGKGYADTEWEGKTDNEMEQMAKEIVNKLDWIKCIVVRIELP